MRFPQLCTDVHSGARTHASLLKHLRHIASSGLNSFDEYIESTRVQLCADPSTAKSLVVEYRDALAKATAKMMESHIAASFLLFIPLLDPAEFNITETEAREALGRSIDSQCVRSIPKLLALLEDPSFCSDVR